MTHGFGKIDELGGVRHWQHRDNGLQLLSWPTAVAPVAAFGIVYKVGSRYEVSGHTGATHFLEHLMFKGSESFNRERGTEIARVLQRVGAAYNATTWLDRTNYYETLPVEELGLAVDLEADRMRGALVRDEDVNSERTVILNELERGENEPFELLMKSSFAHAYLEHPYHHPTIGWRGDVEAMTAEILRRFYDTYYHPDNAWVIVVGDVEEETILEQVQRGFGAIPPAGHQFPSPTIDEGEQRGERRFVLHRAGETASLGLSWHIPEALHDDIPALTVLTQVLSDGVTSRLHQRLVESNLCLGVHAYVLELHDPGLFQVLAAVAPGVDPHDVEQVIREEVAKLASSSPSPAEVARAKVQTRTDIAFHSESPSQIVSALTESVAMGDWRSFLHELERTAAVEAGDLQRVAATYLVDDRLTVGTFIPETPGGGAHLPTGPRPCYLRQPFAERVHESRLANGARVVVLPNPHAPTVNVAGSLLAGQALADDGRFTLPGMTAGMLDRGTESHDRMALAAELEDHGLQMSVRATPAAPTTVTFGGQGLAEEMPRLVALLAEVLRRPTFPETELSILTQRVQSSLVHEREETHPLAFNALSRRLYPEGHPRHRRKAEQRSLELAALRRSDLQAFHRASYGPASLVLAVVGDVEPEAVQALLEQHFGDWKGGVAAVDEWPQPEKNQADRKLIHLDDRPNLDVFFGHLGGLHQGDADEAAATLANSCLGHSTLTSRLGVAVRDRAGLTYGIYSRFFGTLHIPGPWATFLSVSPANLERAEALCREVIQGYKQEGPTEEELTDERTSLAGSFRVGLATNVGVARELVSVLTAGEPVCHLDRFPEQLLAVTREQVIEALRRHIHPDRLVLTAAGSVE